MKNYQVVVSSLRRLMLVIGLLLIGVVSLFPIKSVEMRVRSAPSPEVLPVGKLAFSRTVYFMAATTVSLYYVDANGLREIRVPWTGPDDPDWSPNGARIVYVSLISYSVTDIFTRNLDGTKWVNLTNTPDISERNPSWSVTDKIAYERASQIWTMTSDGSNQAAFSAITQPTPLSPTWSPDGSKLLFSSLGAIWMINADGTNEHRITNDSSINLTPDWSPDASKIVYSNGGISVINADGTNRISLTSNTRDINPVWSPDNNKIAFVRESGVFSMDGIYTMNTDGSNQVRILSKPDDRRYYEHLAWQPVRVGSGD